MAGNPDRVSGNRGDSKMNDNYPGLSSRLVRLTAELEALDTDLRTAHDPDPHLLQGFRRAVDEVRNTAWTIGELINARASKKNPEVVLSFLASERMRRFDQMVLNLADDMDDPSVTWQTSGVQKVAESLGTLQARLQRLLSKHVDERHPLDKILK
jgi:hypothetical protein